MCLAIPAKIVSEPNDNQMAEVDILGVRRYVSLMMTPEARPGEYVLVHAGFAIQVVDEQFAAESLEMLSVMGIQTADEIAAEMSSGDGAASTGGAAPAAEKLTRGASAS